jgi:hypothetical protein
VSNTWRAAPVPYLQAGVDFGSDGFPCVAGTPELNERKAQMRYWEEHSRELTVEAMMLDSCAADLDREDRPEVMRRQHSSRLHSIYILFYNYQFYDPSD